MSSIRIHRLTHVGFVTPDALAAARTWERLFDVRQSAARPVWLAAEEGVYASMMHVTGGGIEPLQPVSPDNIFGAALAAGRGMFHISLRVSDIEAVARRLSAMDMWTQLCPPGDIVRMHRLWIDPASACGAHIELIDREERNVMMALPVGEGDEPVIPGTQVRRMRAVTLIVDDLAEAQHLYGEVFGFRTEAVRDLPEDGVRSQTFHVGSGTFGGGEGGPAIEVVQVTDDRGPFGMLKQRFGVGVAALTLEVDDLAATHQRLTKLGCMLRLRPATDNQPERLWVHPASAAGSPLVLVGAAA